MFLFDKTLTKCIRKQEKHQLPNALPLLNHLIIKPLDSDRIMTQPQYVGYALGMYYQ